MSDLYLELRGSTDDPCHWRTCAGSRWTPCEKRYRRKILRKLHWWPLCIPSSPDCWGWWWCWWGTPSSCSSHPSCPALWSISPPGSWTLWAGVRPPNSSLTWRTPSLWGRAYLARLGSVQHSSESFNFVSENIIPIHLNLLYFDGVECWGVRGLSARRGLWGLWGLPVTRWQSERPAWTPLTSHLNRSTPTFSASRVIKPIMVSLALSRYRNDHHLHLQQNQPRIYFPFRKGNLRNLCSLPRIFSMFSENNYIFLPTFKLNQSIIESFCTFRKYSFFQFWLFTHRVSFTNRKSWPSQTRQIRENKKKYKFWNSGY